MQSTLGIERFDMYNTIVWRDWSKWPDWITEFLKKCFIFNWTLIQNIHGFTWFCWHYSFIYNFHTKVTTWKFVVLSQVKCYWHAFTNVRKRNWRNYIHRHNDLSEKWEDLIKKSLSNYANMTRFQVKILVHLKHKNGLEKRENLITENSWTLKQCCIVLN